MAFTHYAARQPSVTPCLAHPGIWATPTTPVNHTSPLQSSAAPKESLPTTGDSWSPACSPETFKDHMLEDAVSVYKACVTTSLRMCARAHAQSSPSLRDSVDCSPAGSSARGIFHARILEWVAISSSRGSS